MWKITYCIWITLGIIFINSHQVSADSDEPKCDPPWEKLHRTCVQFIKSKPFLSWQEARDSCISMKSDLLSINDKVENGKIVPLLKKHVKSFDLIKWWIGMRQVETSWRWLDNDEKYAKIPEWAPNSGHIVNTQKRCGLLDFKGYLSDVECDTQTKPYICERLKVKTDPTTTTSSTSTTTSSNATSTSSISTTKSSTSTTTSSKATSTSSISTTKSSTSTTMSSNATSTSSIATSTSLTSTTTSISRTVNPTKQQTNKPSTVTATIDLNESSTITSRQKERDKFKGCYDINYESTCPPTEAFGISWPRSESGKQVTVNCDNGQAKWKCDTNPTCWRGEADVKQCTSEALQVLTEQVQDFLSNTSDSEKAVNFTESLAASIESENVLSEQDMFQSTKLMKAASNVKPKNSTDAKKIIQNVAKCGSLLVGKHQKLTNMNEKSRRTVASSLLTTMELVTTAMLKSFDEPLVEKFVEDNMAIELQVITINKDEPHGIDAVFQEESNRFKIPQENLKEFTSGGFARLVFINYNTVGEMLTPEDDVIGDDIERRLVSEVVSATLDEKPLNEPLKEPVTFTMQTHESAKNQEWKQLCSFWNFSLGYTGAWSQEGCNLTKHNTTHTTCQCNHLTNFAILMDIHSTKLTAVHTTTLSYITYIGIIISIICLFMSWITFLCLTFRCLQGSRDSYGNETNYYGNSGSSNGSSTGSRSAQGERNSIHKNLVFCLFIAEVLFLAGIERTDNKIACAVIAGFLHYFFLASFTWMFVEGIHILFMLVQVFDAARSRLRYYYAIGYGIPLVTVGVSAAVYYEGYGTDKYCWLTTDRMFMWSFAGPVSFILLVNLIILLYAMSAVCKHSEYVFTKEKSSVGNIKAWIQGAVALEVLLGLTWIFGYFYISEEAIPMAYLFTIFNSLQGLFIFLFHCILNKKVRKEYARFVDYPRRPVSSGTHTSKGSQHSSGPNTASYHLNGTRKHSGGFVTLNKDSRSSSRSTTST